MSTPSAGSRTEPAAVINGDVAGYSKLVADDEIETHRTLQAFRRIVEDMVSKESGEVVEFVGDEFLAVLPTRPAGVTAAVAIQRALAAENEKLISSLLGSLKVLGTSTMWGALDADGSGMETLTEHRFDLSAAPR